MATEKCGCKITRDPERIVCCPEHEAEQRAQLERWRVRREWDAAGIWPYPKTDTPQPIDEDPDPWT